MIKPLDSFGDRGNGRAIRYGWPLEHEYRYTKRAGRGNFAVRGGTTAVLGHDSVDRIRSKQCLIGGLGKGAARENVAGVRHIERRIHRVNTSNEVVMLRSTREWTQLLASNGEENAPRTAAKCPHGTRRVRDVDPKVSVHGLPRRSAQPQDRNASLYGCQRCVGRDCFRVRVCSVYQKVNVVGLQIRRKTFGAAKSADSYGSSLRCRGCGTTSQRNRCGKRASGKRRGELAGLGSSSQNQDVRLHARRH